MKKYIDNVDRFLDWSTANAFIETVIKYGEKNSYEHRAGENAHKALEELKKYIIELEHETK